jgi:hypothetical protein
MSKIEKKQPRLPESGKGNREIEIVEVGNRRVTMRIMNEFVTYGIITIHGKAKYGYGEISRHSDAQVYDPGTRKQYSKIEKDARKQAFAILSKQASEENPAVRARKIRRDQDPRQSDLF